MDVAEKPVLVTGGGSGIGRALACEFARQGARVAVCGRRAQRLDETVRFIQDRNGTGLAVPADITREDQVRRLVNSIDTALGPVDILFNNAGSFGCIGGVHEVEPDAWWHDVTVNLFGAFLVIRHILPAMLADNNGVIINMNGGRPAGGSSYACGKAGLMELTRLLAEELRRQDSSVMVFGAGPGLVRTEMTELQVTTDAGRRWIPGTSESIQAGKVREPHEIARATMEMLRVARPDLSGRSYNPDTDFSDW